MKFSVAVASFMAVAASAAPAFLNSNFDVQQGVPFTLKYSGCSSGCTIVLANGDSKDIKDYKTLTTSATGDSFTWTPSGIPSDTYAFKITDSNGEVNYSSQFVYKGDGVATTTVSASVTGSASTSAAVSSTQKSTTAKETTATPTKSATTLTKVTTSESVVSTPSQNATTPVSTEASSTKGSKTTAASGTTTAAQTTAATTVPNSGAARLSSSIALIAGAVMAMVYLN